MTVHRIVLVTAAAALLLAIGQSIAQAPPARPADENRMKAIEKHLELLQKSRDDVVAKAETAQKEYTDFRRRTPVQFTGKTISVDNAKQRIAKDTAVALDLQQHRAELVGRQDLVKQVADSDAAARSLLVMLQRRGIDVEAMRRIAEIGKKDVTPVDLVRLYGDSLRPEFAELDRLLKATQDRIEQCQKMAHDFYAFEAQEEQLRMKRDNSQKLLDAIVGQIERLRVLRTFHPK